MSEMVLSGDISILHKFKYGDPSKNAILALGGGQAGIVGAAELKALYDAELFPYRVRRIVGVSAGAGNAWFTLGGDPERAISMYRDDNLDGRLFRVRPTFPHIGMVYDVLEHASRTREPADPKKVLATGVDFRIAVTSTEDWKSYTYKIDQVDDPVTLLMASVHHPVMGSRYNYFVNGVGCIDAVYSDGVPLEYIKEGMGVSNLLVLSPGELRERRISPWVVKMCKLFQPELGEDYYLALARFYDKYNSMLPYLSGRNRFAGMNIATIHPRRSQVGSRTRDRDLLIREADETYNGTRQLLTTYG